MKTIPRIILAVAAVFAVSCTTDVTEDLSVELGTSSQTEIALSLEESRTHINGKEGETYPLYWSTGDKIAVNGVASEALTEDAHGKVKATFTVKSAIDYPRSIVYPAPAEGAVASEGKQVVTFLSNQSYTAGTFAEGAAPMYAYVEDSSEAISLQHLAGVLRFVPKGDVTLTGIIVSVEEGKIAGNFDIDCAEGTLTAQADATNTVVVSLGEGLTLNAEGTPIYVTLPAGDYGVVNVTFYTATDSMSTTFTASGDKAVKAGVIREFPAFDYKANATSDEFVIFDEASLRSFAANVDKFGAEATYKSAKVIADIDMTGKAWTPIGCKTEFVLDGNNCAIKGLTAPLFDTTMTTIKNLRLADVNIVEKENSVVGALARVIASENAVVENCSVSGNIDLAWESTPENVYLYVGAIVGVSSSTKEFKNLTNSANIEISGKLGYVLYCSGIVCHAKNGAITNATNLGNINFTGESAITLRLSGITFICPTLTNCVNGSADAKQEKGAITVSGTLTGGVRVGALMPELDALRGTINITNCANYGAFTINCPTTTLSEVQSGGLLGLNSNVARTVNVNNSHNYGNITITANIKVNIRMSGIVGNVTGSTYVLTECSNHGNLSFDGTSGGEIRLAGMVSALGGGGSVKVVNGYTNTGDIELGEKTCCTGTNIQVGGIAANYSGSIHSASTGIIKNAGNISYKESADNAVITRVGGIIAAANKAFNFDNASFVNEGNITVVGGKAGRDLTVGGIYGNSSKAINNARCYCNIVTTNASVVGMIMAGDYKSAYPVTASHIGGGISKNGGEPTPITLDNYPQYIYNNAPDEVVVVNSQKNGWLASKDADPELKFIAGVKINSLDDLLAWATAETTATSAENVELTTDITLPEGTTWTPVEGYAGTFNGSGFAINGLTAPLFGTTKASIQNLELTNVNIEFTEAQSEYAVLACKIDNAAATVKNCSASGTMKINLDMAEAIAGNDGDIVIGGLVGVTSSHEKFYNLVNEVNVEISGTYKNSIVAAGLIGAGESCSMSSSTNLGSMTYNGTSSNHVFIGGLAVQCKELTDCVNGSAKDASHTKGSLTIDGKTKNAYAAGFAPTVSSSISLIRCHNYGTITYTANATTGGATLLAGAVSYCSPSTAQLSLDSCSNHGPILVNNSVVGGDLKVGGLVGHLGGSVPIIILNGYTNEGDFTINPKSVASSKSVQVGGMIGNYSATWTETSTGTLRNKGNITYAGASSSESTVRIAGILAALAKEPPTSLKMVNTGNLNVTGTGKAVNVGGILGAGKKVSNAICYCDMKVQNVTSYGWIIAAARSATLYATNCAIGGRFMKWDDTDGEFRPHTIEEYEFQNYIYSSGESTDWTGTDNYDGCTHLSAMPTLE